MPNEFGPWDYLLWVALEPWPWPWPGWLLGLAGIWYALRKRQAELGLTCILAGWHYVLALSAFTFTEVFRGLTQVSCTYGFSWSWEIGWPLSSYFLPMTVLTCCAAPALVREDLVRGHLRAISSVAIGFLGVTLGVVGIYLTLVTPSATLRSLVR